MKMEHIGIAVKDLEQANDLYAKLLGKPHYKTEKVESEQVITSFFKSGQAKIELLQSMEPDGVIAKFIEKKGEGIHHVAFRVKDIYEEKERLIKEGFRCLNEEPKKGADNMLVCFFHPKDTNGVLIELCEKLKKD